MAIGADGEKFFAVDEQPVTVVEADMANADPGDRLHRPARRCRKPSCAECKGEGDMDAKGGGREIRKLCSNTAAAPESSVILAVELATIEPLGIEQFLHDGALSGCGVLVADIRANLDRRRFGTETLGKVTKTPPPPTLSARIGSTMCSAVHHFQADVAVEPAEIGEIELASVSCRAGLVHRLGCPAERPGRLNRSRNRWPA